MHGRVRVLLRVEHRDRQVHQLDQPVNLEPVPDPDRVQVRQVEQDEPVQLGGTVPVDRQQVPPGHLQPVQQRRGRVPPPHPGVRGGGGRPAHPNAGDRPPTSGLNSEDPPTTASSGASNCRSRGSR